MIHHGFTPATPLRGAGAHKITGAVNHAATQYHAVTHRHVVIPQNLDTLPSTGKLGDLNFQPIEGGDSGRATESRRPVAAPRTGSLLQQPGRIARPPAPAPRFPSPPRGIRTNRGPYPKATSFGSQVDNLNEIDGTVTRHPNVGNLDAHSARFAVRAHSLTQSEDAARRSASAPPDYDTLSLGQGRNPSHNIAPQVVEETAELPPTAGINERAIDVPPPPTKPLRVRVPRGAPRRRHARKRCGRPPPSSPDPDSASGCRVGHPAPVGEGRDPSRHPGAGPLREKKTRYTGAAPLPRAIARAQRHSPDAAAAGPMGLYKALPNPHCLAIQTAPQPRNRRPSSASSAALAQRASAEGAQAVDQDLIKRVLTPMLHSLPVETLCELGRLNDANNGLGDKILHDAGKLLGADKSPRTPAGARARRGIRSCVGAARRRGRTQPRTRAPRHGTGKSRSRWRRPATGSISGWMRRCVKCGKATCWRGYRPAARGAPGKHDAAAGRGPARRAGQDAGHDRPGGRRHGKLQ